jgi:hypothetical protein
MQTDPVQFSPETLRTLQRHFDFIWRCVDTSRSRYAFPWDAQASREKIATLLYKRVDELLVDPQRVTKEVLELFEAGEAKAGRLAQSRARR